MADDWLADVRARVEADAGRLTTLALYYPGPGREDIPRLLACAEVLQRLVANERHGLPADYVLEDPLWAAAEKAVGERP